MYGRFGSVQVAAAYARSRETIELGSCFLRPGDMLTAGQMPLRATLRGECNDAWRIPGELFSRCCFFRKF